MKVVHWDQQMAASSVFLMAEMLEQLKADRMVSK